MRRQKESQDANADKRRNSGYTVMSLTKPTAEQVRAFQILAIAKMGKMLTLSQAVQLATKLAAERLQEEKTQTE